MGAVAGDMSVSDRSQLIGEIERLIGGDRARGGLDKSDLSAVIGSALALDYVSESCRGGIQTGNHYQSVRLGATVTAGFRGDRTDVLDRIDFRGRTVLDLGSNLGELSRAARERGAARVVGIEYDDFFVAIARGLNALNDVEGVEFRQGDIADPRIYDEAFDIVLAFSVFQYVGDVLEHVCRIARDVLVVETHKLDGNLLRDYVVPVRKQLPAFTALGRSDWSIRSEAGGQRAVMAFARDEAVLAAALTAAAGERGDAGGARERVDVARTSRALQSRFLECFSFESLEHLLDAVRTTSVDLGAMGNNRDVARGYRGWLYWFMYLKGYVEYLDSGVVGDTNAFRRYFAEHHLPRVDEPGIGSEQASAIAQRRFADLDAMRRAPRHADDLVDKPSPPIRITVSDPPPPDPLLITFTTRQTERAALLDGWHRLFGAAICGIRELEAEVVYEAYPPVHGRIEHYEVTADGTLRLDGWCFSSSEPWAFIELRACGRAIARATPAERPDVAAAAPDRPHAGASGFSFTCPAPPDDCLTLDVLPTQNWLPIGRMRLHRGRGAHGLHHLALATGIGQSLAALQSVLPPDGLVLAVGSETAAVAGSLLPAAEIRTVDGRPAPWHGDDDAARLLIAGYALGGVPEMDRYAWLEHAATAVRPGGALVLGDRGWLPPDLPPHVEEVLRLPPQPVDASETVTLARV